MAKRKKKREHFYDKLTGNIPEHRIKDTRSRLDRMYRDWKRDYPRSNKLDFINYNLNYLKRLNKNVYFQKRHIGFQDRLDRIRDDTLELRRLKICHERKARREVLFAKKKAGKGNKIKGKRILTDNSTVRC
jgi:hypothetical protein